MDLLSSLDSASGDPMRACMCVCVCVCMCTYVCVFAFACMYLCLCICVYLCMRVCEWVSMCVGEQQGTDEGEGARPDLDASADKGEKVAAVMPGGAGSFLKLSCPKWFRVGKSSDSASAASPSPSLSSASFRRARSSSVTKIPCFRNNRNIFARFKVKARLTCAVCIPRSWNVLCEQGLVHYMDTSGVGFNGFANTPEVQGCSAFRETRSAADEGRA